MATPDRLQLVRMHQLAEAHCDDDNWTGLKDPAERRKRQVRLSLRAHRGFHLLLLWDHRTTDTAFEELH